MSNASGEIQEQYSYSPFGQSNDVSAVGNPLRYAARRLDDETGYYYYRARYYDPAMGRFLQADPIGYGDGMNMYAYVGNDPVNFIDPLGTFATMGGFSTTQGAVDTSSISFEAVSVSNEWSQIGTIHKGDSQFTFDAGSEISVQPWSSTVGLEQFTATISAWPLNSSGNLQSVVQPINSRHSITIPFVSGFNSGVGVRVNAHNQLNWSSPHFGGDGFRWRVSFRPQQDIHQNSSGYRIHVFGRKP